MILYEINFCSTLFGRISVRMFAFFYKIKEVGRYLLNPVQVFLAMILTYFLENFCPYLPLPWGNEDTSQLIDILAKYDVKATFFVVGDWVDKYPESVKQLSDAGHEVMNHSNKHPHMPELSQEKMRAEITECNNKIEAITGVKPILFRAPYGDYNNETIKTIRECGCYPIQWDVDSIDWKDIEADQITKRVTSKVKPGSIVLFHNAAKHTPEALPQILEKLKSDGYSIVPISQLIYADNYTIDSTGRQHLNSN